MLPKKQPFRATVYGRTYEFRHDPATISVWTITRLDQPSDELLDSRKMIFPKGRFTHRQMIDRFTETLASAEG